MRFDRLLIPALGAAVFFSCGKIGGGSGSTSDPLFGPGTEKQETSNEDGGDESDEKLGALEFWLQDMGFDFTAETGDDAFDYTFGTMRLEVVAVLGGYAIPDELASDPIRVEGERKIYMRKVGGGAFDPTKLPAADKALLDALCADLHVSATGDFKNVSELVKESTLGTNEIHIA